MSLTQWLTRSAPQVSWRPISIATFSFVPTPSVDATRTGSRNLEKSGLEQASEAADVAEDPRA